MYEKRRLLGVAMAAALVAGAGTAVVTAQADSGGIAREGTAAITLEGSLEKRLTVRGSSGHEAITVRGDAGATVALNADQSFTNMRTDCTTAGPATTNATCEGDFQKIEVELGGGSDGLIFKQFLASGVKILARGAAGGDHLSGSGARDFFEGGDGGDDLSGRGGDDELDGGAGHDHCDGGSGQDKISDCE